MHARTQRIFGIVALLAALAFAACANGAPPLERHQAVGLGAATPRTRAASPESGPSFVQIQGAKPYSQIASDDSGGEWFYEVSQTQSLTRVDENSLTLERFNFFSPSDFHGAPVAVDDDKQSMWFGLSYHGDRDAFPQIFLSSYQIRQHKVPQATEAHGMAAGLDNAMWFTDEFVGKIGRLDPATHKLYTYRLPSGDQPHDITRGPDGAMWFTVPAGSGSGGGKIGRIDIDTHKIVLYFVRSDVSPWSITGTPNALWFTDRFSGPTLGRIDVRTHARTYFDPPLGSTTDIVWRKPDLWVTTDEGDLGEFDPSNGQAHTYKIPHSKYGDAFLERGADNQLWVTEPDQQRLWRFCPDLNRTQCANPAR